jgi:nitrite reductase/ring-hydroxylating ferredoxin subunit
VPIQAVWIEPQLVAGAVSIPVNQVENNRNVHFKIEDETGELHFMAYALNGELHLRASICPPCRGIAYSLDGDVLVCDTCATTFRAKTGDGIKGACVNYPKAAVPFDVVDGSIVATQSDLLVAYERTLEPGWP